MCTVKDKYNACQVALAEVCGEPQMDVLDGKRFSIRAFIVSDPAVEWFAMEGC